MQLMTLAALLLACNYGVQTTVDGDDSSGDVVETNGQDLDADGVPTPTDCNDDDASVFPGAPEICDDQDNDCDGLIDDADEEDIDQSTLRPYYLDSDGDGVGSAWLGMRCSTPDEGSLLGTDCDDKNADAYPDAPELCDDIDNDCDGLVDDADDSLDEASATTWFLDEDGDGEGQSAQQVRQCAPVDGYVRGGSDCDDEDPTIFPGAAELCDAVDNDCDGLVDDEDEDLSGEGSRFWYGDQDGDAHGSAIDLINACTQPEGYVDNADDCDDTDPSRYVGAPEVCDGKDNNCDAATGFLIDDQDPDVDLTTVQTFYPDTDGDGRGDASAGVVQCTAPAGTVSNADDCDDTDPSIWLGAPEVCDDVDNNCDGTVDDEDPLLDFSTGTAFWVDGDGDGFGVDGQMLVACEVPEGMARAAGDCDDANPDVWTGAEERCDGVDNDCDGVVDGGVGASGAAIDATYYLDLDGDGFGDPATATTSCEQPEGSVTQDGDCDDTDPSVFAGAPERCDGVDNNCNGQIDSVDELDGLEGVTLYADRDGDGFGSLVEPVVACEATDGLVANAEDCDDDNGQVGPTAVEVCDGVDNNCDGLADEDDPTLDTATLIETWTDADGDGFGLIGTLNLVCTVADGMATIPGDCNDDDARAYVSAPEVCDGVDNDCSGAADDDDPGLDLTSAQAFYADVDGDGWGDAAAVVQACLQPAATVAVAGDCDDSDSAIFEGAPELCDGVDNDCDGLLDGDDDVVGGDGPVRYVDADGDGFGDPNAPVQACDGSVGLVDNDEDCDDTTAAVSPDGREICDGIDNDCNNGVDDAAAWGREDLAYRVTLDVVAPAYPTLAPPISVDVDFGAYLAEAGDGTAVDMDSIAVVLQDCAAGMPQVPSEFADDLAGLFERGDRTDVIGDSFGALTFLYDEDGDLTSRDVLDANSTARFAVYFSSEGAGSPVASAAVGADLMVGLSSSGVRIANSFSAASLDESAGGLVDSFGPSGIPANVGSQVASDAGNGVYLDQLGGGSPDAGWLSAADSTDATLEILHDGPMVALVRASGTVSAVHGGFEYSYDYMMLAGRPELYAAVRYVTTEESTIGPAGASSGAAVRPYQVDNLELVNQSAFSQGRAGDEHTWVRGGYLRGDGAAIGVLMAYRAAPETLDAGTASAATGRYLALAGHDGVASGTAQQVVPAGTVLLDDAMVSVFAHAGAFGSHKADFASSVTQYATTLGALELAP